MQGLLEIDKTGSRVVCGRPKRNLAAHQCIKSNGMLKLIRTVTAALSYQERKGA